MFTSILTILEYGQVHIKLKELLESRSISRNALAKCVNTNFDVIDRWWNDNVEKIDADIIARICYVLECDLTDLIEYIPPEEQED